MEYGLKGLLNMVETSTAKPLSSILNDWKNLRARMTTFKVNEPNKMQQNKMMRIRILPESVTMLILVLCFICIQSVSVEAQSPRLQEEEVQVLREIAKELGKKDWNFSVDPCLNDSSWATPMSDYRPMYQNTLNCNCSDGVCHVTKIFLKGQDLAGVLPPSLAKLPYLIAVDFTRNFLSGNIPPEWGSTNLEYLSVAVNNLSGPIPTEMGNITSLRYMSLENNLFNGTVPPVLRNLVNLESLILSANSLSGELPMDLSNLTKLKELRVSSNYFSGAIPDFFDSLNQLQILEIQASGLEGPIPPRIFGLSNLIELRISDLSQLRGSNYMVFPPLINMTSMRRLMLRSCNLIGVIPDFTSMPNLEILDLSFNGLVGHIGAYFGTLSNLQYLYLTSNTLTGSIPASMLSRDSRVYTVDLSYNDLSNTGLSCTSTLPNLFNSFSAQDNSCPQESFFCSKDQYSLHINCGGKSTTIGGVSFEGDQVPGGASKFVASGDNWGFSSTGHFWDTDELTPQNYIANNVSTLGMEKSELFTSARLSPLSLTYYARCLAIGNYSVSLYFSEIIIRGNRSFQSLGRRIFDVYIQEKLVLKDFDIEREAVGVDKALIKIFFVSVKEKTLEIRFHWSGKGTTASPKRGVYGPIISAISIEFESALPARDSKRKVLIVATASAGGCFLCLLILAILWRRGRVAKGNRGLDMQTSLFTFQQIKAATNNFDLQNKIGEGGFGPVYKGILLDGTVVAVKQLSSKSKQGNREFVNEIGMISSLQHPNLVRLYGSCIEANELLLVYEYMENNSLAHALFGPEEGPEEGPVKLDWPTRQRICIGIAKGLAFLHEESAIKVVHRDIKTANVLLDEDLNAKISDFGLAKLDEEENTHICTRVAGTIGYMAPEYALWGYLTFKADVFSFGVVALEIVAGKNNMKFRPNENFAGLVDWALALQQKERLVELVDPRLGSDFNKEEAVRMVKVALLCINPAAALRPAMSAVVSMLEGQTPVDEIKMDPSIYSEEMRLTALRNPFEQTEEESAGGTRSLIHSSDASWNGPSAPTSSDLYKISPSFRKRGQTPTEQVLHTSQTPAPQEYYTL